MNQKDDIPAIPADMIVPEREGGYSKGRETREMILRAALSILIVKRRSKGTPDRRRRGTPFSDNMMLVC